MFWRTINYYYLFDYLHSTTEMHSIQNWPFQIIIHKLMIMLLIMLAMVNKRHFIYKFIWVYFNMI